MLQRRCCELRELGRIGWSKSWSCAAQAGSTKRRARTTAPNLNCPKYRLRVRHVRQTRICSSPCPLLSVCCAAPPLAPRCAAPVAAVSPPHREGSETCSCSNGNIQSTRNHMHAQVLDGELAQRAEASRRLREVQKQLMLLGGLVPPSPVVTATAARLALPREEALQQEAARLQDAIDRHSTAVKVCRERAIEQNPACMHACMLLPF